MSYCTHKKITEIKLVYKPCQCNQCRNIIGRIEICTECGHGAMKTNTRGHQFFWAGDIVEVEIDDSLKEITV